MLRDHFWKKRFPEVKDNRGKAEAESGEAEKENR